MEKEIVNQIVALLEQFESNQLSLLIAMFFVMFLVNVFQAVYTSRVVERYKNELKKKEMKFSVYNQIQIEKLSELFEFAHDLKCSAVSVSRRSNEPESSIADINGFDVNYEKFDDCYSKHRYILPRKIKSHIKDGSKLLSEFKCNISLLVHKNEILSLNENLDDKQENINNIEIIDREIEGYNFERAPLEVMLFCEELKVLIEDYFDELE